MFRRVYHELYPAAALAAGRTVIIDGSYAKAHRSAAGARVDRSGELCGFWCPEQCPPKRPWYCPATQAIGKTRGGPNTNVVIAVNEDRQLVNWTLLAGNVPESKAMPRLLEGIRPSVVVADGIHDNNQIRRMLDNRRIEGQSPTTLGALRTPTRGTLPSANSTWPTFFSRTSRASGGWPPATKRPPRRLTP